jgi:hypothetical protein
MTNLSVCQGQREFDDLSSLSFSNPLATRKPSFLGTGWRKQAATSGRTPKGTTKDDAAHERSVKEDERQPGAATNAASPALSNRSLGLRLLFHNLAQVAHRERAQPVAR